MARALTCCVLAAVALLLPVFEIGAPRAAPPCELGASRSVDVDPSEGRLITPPFVVGCTDLRTHGHLELIGYRAGQSLLSSELCIEIQTRRGVSASCRNPNDPLRGLEAAPTEVHSKRRVLLEGFASPQVKHVSLRYRSGGRVRRSRAVLAQASSESLEQLGSVAPFAYFTAEAPRRVDRVVVLARNKAGRLIFRESVPVKWVIR